MTKIFEASQTCYCGHPESLHTETVGVVFMGKVHYVSTLCKHAKECRCAKFQKTTFLPPTKKFESIEVEKNKKNKR